MKAAAKESNHYVIVTGGFPSQRAMVLTLLDDTTQRAHGAIITSSLRLNDVTDVVST